MKRESVPSTATGTPPGENVPIPGRPKIPVLETFDVPVLVLDAEKNIPVGLGT